MSPYSRIKLNFDYTRIKPPEKLSLIRVRGMGISGALLDSPYFLIKARRDKNTKRAKWVVDDFGPIFGGATSQP